MNIDKIYPDYNFEKKGRYGFIFSTNIRKLGADKLWYLIPTVYEFEINKNISRADKQGFILNILKMCHEDCYKRQLFFDIKKRILIPTDPQGDPLYAKVDSCQLCEEERIRDLWIKF